MADYSLWGGSAGARMAAWLGSYGTQSFGEQEYPRPASVIMQYTGLSDVTGNERPTYNCVGTRDGIASYRIMEDRISRTKSRVRTPKSRCLRDCPTALDWEKEPQQKGGLTAPSPSGRGKCRKQGSMAVSGSVLPCFFANFPPLLTGPPFRILFPGLSRPPRLKQERPALRLSVQI